MVARKKLAVPLQNSMENKQNGVEKWGQPNIRAETIASLGCLIIFM